MITAKNIRNKKITAKVAAALRTHDIVDLWILIAIAIAIMAIFCAVTHTEPSMPMIIGGFVGLFIGNVICGLKELR